MNPSENNNSTNGVQINMPPHIDKVSYSATQDLGTPQNILVSATHTEISSSPLPSPEILKGYTELIPNGAERFMNMVEREQENRFENDRADRYRIKNDIDLKRRGQTIAFCLVIIFLITGIILSFIGQSVISYILLGMALAPVAGLFYKHKST